MLAATGFLLMLVAVPLFPSAPFLKYDTGDIPVLIGAFALGPWLGVWIALLKDLLYLLFHFTPETLVGAPMNFLAGATYACTAGGFYALRKTKTRAAISLGLGALVCTTVMALANLTVLPLFMRVFMPDVPPVDRHTLVTLLWSTIVPFNLLKASLNGVLCFLVYKKISPVLKTARWELAGAVAAESP